MAVDPLQDWKDTLEDMPKVDDSSWAANFADWYEKRLQAFTSMGTGLIPDAASLDVAAGWSFVFGKVVFQAQLMTLTPTTSALAGITGFANAWEAALLASTAVVSPGAFIPPASPGTTFSAVASTLIDVPSIAAGKAKILELTAAPVVDNAQDSQFPIKFREATVLLSVTVAGTNSVSPTTGPLTAPLVPLV